MIEDDLWGEMKWNEFHEKKEWMGMSDKSAGWQETEGVPTLMASNFSVKGLAWMLLRMKEKEERN